ncbi:MAG: helix-turn-helix domain-containing protein [Ruminococcaceae bacterium]|nr:helix-turn-helix domain-containing protein [Oscillospiraceae bacterium]
MYPDAYKELTPVVYGEKAVKKLPIDLGPHQTCIVMHWHERIELLYVYEGELILQIGDRPFTVKAGQVGIVNPCQLHAIRTEEHAVRFDALMFEIAHFCNDTSATRQHLEPLHRMDVALVNVTDDPEVLDSVKRLVCLLDDEQAPALTAIGEVYRLLGWLTQRCCTAPRAVHTTDKKFGTVLQYINQHFTEPLSTCQLSRLFSYNEAYFCRQFKRLTGLTVSAHLRILRMEQAQNLLRTTNLGIAAIAARCGFTDPEYFTNCFTRQYGCSPTAFRRQ